MQRRILIQGLPPEIADTIMNFLPRPGKPGAGTAHAKLRKLSHPRTPPSKWKPNKVSKTYLKSKGKR